MKLFRRMLLPSLFRLPLFSLALFGFLQTARGGEIHFKDGKVIEGIVKDSGGDEVLIETAGGVFSFKRSSIDKIVQGSELNNLLSRARAEELRQNYIKSADYYIKALDANPTAEEKSEIVKSQQAVIEKYVESLNAHNVLVAGLQDVQDIEALKTQFSDPRILAMLQAAKIRLDNNIAQANFNEGRRLETNRDFAGAIEHFQVVLKNYPEHPVARGLNSKIPELYVVLGEKFYERGKGDEASSKKAFENAIMLEPDNTIALYYLGMIADSEENYEQAKKYLSLADPSKLANWQVKRREVMLNRAERKLAPPKEPVIRSFRPIEPVNPDANLTRTQKVGKWFTEKLDHSKQLFSNVGSSQVSMDFMPQVFEWLKFLGIVFGALILFWYIPLKMVANDLPKRKVLYYNWRKIVTFTGLIGMILYFIDRMIQEKPRKRCPSCDRAIDNPALFENYEFNLCPYCQAQIKPPYSLPGLMAFNADALKLDIAKSKNPMHDEGVKQQALELLNMAMIHALKCRAGDLHFTPKPEGIVFEYHVDGIPVESVTVDSSLLPPLMVQLKGLCNLNSMDVENSQTGHFRKILSGEDINMRVSTKPGTSGESAHVRIIDPRIAAATLDRLGMSEEHLEQYRQAIRQPEGLILAVGPAASGITTFQYASAHYLKKEGRSVATIENPVDIELEGIRQEQPKSTAGLSSANLLQLILDDRPGAVILSQVPDQETAALAFETGSDGRLILAALPTLDAVDTLARLAQSGISLDTLSRRIVCIVAMRLVRRLCSHCRKQSSATAQELKQLGNDGRLLEGQLIHRPRGCRECNNSGYVGRTGVFELLTPDEEIRGLIANGASSDDLRAAMANKEIKTLRADGILKTLASATSIEEILRITSGQNAPKESTPEPAGVS